MEFFQYISEKALILLPVLWIIGSFLKKTPKIEDWTIPWLLLIPGIIGGLCLTGLNIEGVIQGILVTGTAVLGNQMLKQLKKSKE